MKRKILSTIVALLLVVALLPMSILAASYTDTDGHWAEKSIDRWSAAGIVQGTGDAFAPDSDLTCAQLVTILAKLLRLPAANDAGFSDNLADAWYYDAINRCAAAGILNGYADGTVRPNETISRARAMVMLARALGIEPAGTSVLNGYADAANVPDWARGYVAALLRADIVSGVSGSRLAALANITRAQFVTILDRAIAIYADEDGATVKADDVDGIIVVVAEDVQIKNAPAGTKVVAAASAKSLKVNGKSVDANDIHIVPETAERPKSVGHAHTHEYKYTDNGDGTHTGVCTANDSTLEPAPHEFDENCKCTICGALQPKTAVASVLGEDGTYTYCNTLAVALAAAADGGTVKLVADIENPGNLTVTNKKVTLDMTGHTITSNDKQVFNISGTGDLTITGNGTIAGPTGNTAKALDGKAMLMVSGTDAKLTVLDGTITAGGVGSDGMYGIYVADGGNVFLGDADAKTGPSITTWFAAVGENNTTSPANITIYGGKYTAQAAPAESIWWTYFCAPIYASASGDINIYGGTFNGYYGISSRYVKVAQNLNILGGTFNGTEAALFVDTQDGSAKNGERVIAITGGTFSTDPTAYLAAGYKATENDGIWTVEKMGWNDYPADASVVPAGLVIKEYTNGEFDALDGRSGTVTIKDKEALLYFAYKLDPAAAHEACLADHGHWDHTCIWYGGAYARHIVLDADIDLENITLENGFGNMKDFTFDGQGHTIKNVTINYGGTKNSGLFVGGNQGISDLIVENVHVNVPNSTEGAAGIVSSDANADIANVTVRNSSVTGGKYTGAIVGYNYGSVTNCKVENCTVSGRYKIGGVIGYICGDETDDDKNVTGNTLTGVTVKGENLIEGKSDFVIGKIVGNWNAPTGKLSGNSFSGTTDATNDIGKTESGCTVTGIPQ